MLNQSAQNQNPQTNQISNASLPAFMTNTPPQLQNQPKTQEGLEEQAEQVIQTTPAGGSDSPKRLTKGKIIAGIVGIIILVVGVGTGIVLVQRQQEIREKAACYSCPGGTCPDGWSYGPDECSLQPCDARHQEACSSHQAGGEEIQYEYITFTCDKCDGRRCQTPDVGVNPRMSFGNNPCACCQVDRRPKGSTDGWEMVSLCAHDNWCVAQPSPTPTPTPTPPPGKTPTPTPTATPTPTPTPPPGITAQCLNIKAFDSKWQQLSANDLANIKSGETVRFTVSGSTTAGNFNKARFTFNGTQNPEVASKRPGTDEFYDEFKIPDIPTGQTSLTISINAQIHHSTLGWF